MTRYSRTVWWTWTWMGIYTNSITPSGWLTGTDGLARPAIDGPGALLAWSASLRTLLRTQTTLVPCYKPTQHGCYCVCGTEPPWLNW